MERKEVQKPAGGEETGTGQYVSAGKKYTKISEPDQIEARFSVSDVASGYPPEQTYAVTGVKGSTSDHRKLWTCTYNFTGSDVKKLLDKLNGAVNRTVLDFNVELHRGEERILNETVWSDNLVYLYRRKVLVFLPGLLGSTISLETGKDGETKEIYPDYSNLLGVGGEAGVLECDENGEPLLSATSEIFRLLGSLSGTTEEWEETARDVGQIDPRYDVADAVADLIPLLKKGVVYDVLDKARVAWQEKVRNNYPQIPAGDEVVGKLMPLHARVRPYDWRLNLEDVASRVEKEVRHDAKMSTNAMSEQLRTLTDREDYDSRIALAGHSTGGVILRRLCGKDGIDNFVDQAFFMNVPFRGAPKSLSVFLIGGYYSHKEKAFKSLVRFFDQWSIAKVASTLPIVYFLAPSPYYPNPVTPYGNGREDEKAKLARLAQDNGLDVPLHPVKARTKEKVRKALAKTAEAWHTYQCRRDLPESYEQWIEQTHVFRERWLSQEGPSGTEAEPVVGTGGADSGQGHYQRPTYSEEARQRALERGRREGVITDAQIATQKKHRLSAAMPSNWNDQLAKAAKEFHEKSECEIKSSSVHLNVFYSKGHKTTVEVKLDKNKLDRLGNITPKTGSSEGPFVTAIADLRRKKSECVKVASGDGDGTVPHKSLIGIGAKNANIFEPIPSNPTHRNAPNEPWVWERVYNVILNETEAVKKHLSQDRSEKPA